MESGRPLQIIDFKLVDGKKILILNEDNLKLSLKGVGDLPVSLISITGASRQGKSFLLSFMVKYLEALRIDESDWMGWDNSAEALVGFKWRDGINPETSGMWLWSEPFIVESNGERIAILLMDTQGTFDEFTTEREWSTIVGLSMLMSSCMIFNCQANIQENILNTLEAYVEYGMKALQQNGMEGDKPFQKLMFLIRDWRMVSSHPYGPKGGAAFYKDKFSLKPGQSEQAQRVRKSIQDCFDAIECFLMPEPGERAKEENFNGAISQLSPQFSKKIEAFVTDLLNPDDLLKKSVFGVDVTGQDVINYFVTYVKIFNGDSLPEPMSLYNATARLTNQNLVQRAKNIYLENMKKKQRGSNFWSEKKFVSAHTESEKKAVEYFKKAKKHGNSGLVMEAGEMFEDEISKESKNLQLQNKNKRDKEIDKATLAAVENYNEKMEEEVSENFMDDKKLIGFSDTFTDQVVEEFEQKFEEEEQAVQKLVLQLKEKLGSEQNTFVEQNKLKRSEAEQFMNNLVEETVNWHCEKLNDRLKENEIQKEKDMHAIQKELHGKSVEKFSDAEKKGDRSFIANYKKELEETLDLKGGDLIRHYVNEQNQKRLKTETLITELVNEFKEKLTIDTSCAENEDSLRAKKDEYSKVASQAFQQKHAFSSSNEVVTNLAEELNSKLARTFEEDILDKYHLKLKESDSSFEKAYTDALDSYSQDMESFLATNAIHDEDDLESCKEERKKVALDVYNKAPKLGKNVEEKNKETVAKLQAEIEKLFVQTLEQNALKKSTLEQKSQNDVSECLKEYQAEMKTNLELARDEVKLKEFHEAALKNAISSFRNKCIVKSDETFLQKYCSTIETEIEELFEEISELFGLKQEEQSHGTEKALMDAKRYYHEEMAKHVSNTQFMRPVQLEKLHADVSKSSIDRCSLAAPLTQLQKDDLLASLKITFRQYEETNNMNVPVDPAIGIDLGTTYSCVSVYHKGKVEVIPNKEGKKTTPSYVAFKNGVEIIGEAAKNQAHENPENTIFDAKRIIGRRLDDEKLQSDIKLWPFKVVEEDGIPKVEAEGKTYYPEQISAKVLQEMRVNAEAFLGCPVTKAVITVPAYFTDGQRKATEDAGEIAGLKVLKIIDEPVAAAIAYKLQHMDNENRNVLIFDLGGGTFDVAVLEMRRGEIEVKAKDGDTHLGGEDFDNNLVEHCALEFQAQQGLDILEGRDSTNVAMRRKCLKSMRRLRNESEKRKIDLAAMNSVAIKVDSIEGSHDLAVNVTRDEFEGMNNEYFVKTVEIVERVLKSAGKDKSQIDDIVLVGGSTRIPKIQQLLMNYFGGKALNKAINPDEAVAIGAAIQAAILNGEIAKESQDFNNILDITPYAMGVEVYGGGFSIIIPKNHRIPCKIEDTYRTAHNNQTSVQIVVFQGEKPKAVENSKLGEFYLNGIPPADAGLEVVKVILCINQQGVLEVTAACSSNGVSNTGLTVNENRWRLGRDKINKILAEGRSAP